MKIIKGIGFFTALSGASAVGLGAFAAHADLDVQAALWINKAVDYQFIHSLGLIGLIAIRAHMIVKFWRAAVCLFMVGMLLFCGSLYALAFSGGAPLYAQFAPFGGMSFILGWLCLGIGIVTHKKPENNPVA